MREPYERSIMSLRGRVARHLVLALLPAIALLVATAGCSRDKAESKQPPRRPPVPVAVATVEQRDIPLQIQAIGAVEAYTTITVRALVGGALMRVHFKEGQDVRAGDLLFTIDPRPYEAALAQTQANLAKDRAQVEQARAALERDRARVGQSRAGLLRDQAQEKTAVVQERRYADLLKKELISQEQYDQIRTTAESLAATLRADEADVRSAEETVVSDEAAIKSAEALVRADEAAVQNARLNLGYTKITSPVNGRTGSFMLHEGNVVQANSSTLLVINQIQPIYVSFTVPQQQLPEIKRYMAAGKLTVDAVPSGERRPAQGVVTFIDNAVEPTTGTIRLKATCSNDDKRLWPGQFVNVALTLATETDAIVAPSAAVQTGQQGQAYVFVVKPDSTVEVRRVAVARTQGSDSIIKTGLQTGEKVVTDGQQRLVAGTKVEMRGAGRPAGGERPAGTEKPTAAERPVGGQRPPGR
jgi:multidrug efflux system membrane fusion protein